MAEGWSLFFIGLDGFKSVNETYGHDAGDALLIAVGQALRSCVDDDQMAARVGGDEFVLISDEPTAHLLKRISNGLIDPFEISGRRIQVSASIGHLQIDDASGDASTLLADAEFALRHVKSLGGHRALGYSSTLREGQDLQEHLQRDLAEAMRSGQIEPWFQPQVRLADGQLHGAEILVRWQHPTRGLLTPDVFLPVAERAGMMVDLDHAVWERAMDLAHGWQTAGLWQPVLSLNAAPETISDPLLIERFLIKLHRHSIGADQIVIEVIEDTLIDGKDDMATINIDSLSEAGIKLELDDFGTGYGFLSKLVKLPIDGIKLDRSLISPLPEKSTDTVVRAMLALATELGLHVVAEGIEDATQMRHLNNLGCGYGQGFGFARPMPPDAFAAWLGEHAERPINIPASLAGKTAQA
ncbi:MAG: bifunctional diguanylate cyclase/phosphodiesterase [Pseudomonadota bacterium]